LVLITIQIQQVFKQTAFTIVCYYMQSLSHFGFMGVIVASNTQKNNNPIIFYYACILCNLNSFEPNVKNESNLASLIRINVMTFFHFRFTYYKRIQRLINLQMIQNQKIVAASITFVFSPMNLSNLVNYG